jgi:uncharacterized protein YdbL (DUF1318 family)
MLLMLAACVTINVYFPAAEAQQAADRIIRDVYGEDSGTAPQNEAPSPGSMLQMPRDARPLYIGLLEWLVTPAQAAADINIQSPAIRALRTSMEKRFAQLKPYYQNGSVGMTNNGLIQVRDLNAVALRDRKTVNALVADENRDRQALYAEIAKANGHPEWEKEIRSTFAGRWIANAPAGWWYQAANGQWKQK